ncbi:MAG: penicillin-insensitive murein endopeptidase [Sandaracinaceae bacterium]
MLARASTLALSLLVVGCSASERPSVAANRTEEVVSAEPTTESAAPEPAPVVEAPPEPPPAPPPEPVEVLLAMTGGESTSVGAPTDGRIEGAVALPEAGPGFESNLRRPNAEAFYGTVELVQALALAARVVQDDMPGSMLRINDIGLPEGGPIAHHGSHRAGRDVDVLFYLLDRHGDPIESVGAFLDPRGRGYDFKDLTIPEDDVLVRLDAPRTWRFVRALLEGAHRGDVQRIFVAEHIRTLLLAEAERSRAPRAVRDRFAEITCQPSYPHDDHLHIRFHCTVEDMAEGCQDSSPVYAWRRAALREAGVRPSVYRPRRDRPSSPTTSAEEARAAAGPMHARVEEWLERRRAWEDPPHPGRPFCR